MDIWQKMYQLAASEYAPKEVTPFIYAHNMVCTVESITGQLFTGFCIESCSGVCNLCAERMAALNMYANSGQTTIKRLICFRDRPPFGGGSGMPCGACREFLMQLSIDNRQAEIMIDYDDRKTCLLGDLMPNWWGIERYGNF